MAGEGSGRRTLHCQPCLAIPLLHAINHDRECRAVLLAQSVAPRRGKGGWERVGGAAGGPAAIPEQQARCVPPLLRRVRFGISLQHVMLHVPNALPVSHL